MLRRFAVVGGLVLVAGCSLKDALSGHQDVVATAAGQELTVERVAAMIAPAKAVPLRREVVDRVAELWVDYQLLAQAVAGGDSLLDSATVEAASWPIIVQAMANSYHDSVVASAKPTAAQVDSAYNGNDYRYIQHILVAVKQDTTDAVKAAKRRIAEGYLAQVRGGTNFGQLASRVTDDPGSKENGGGYFFGRGRMAKPFEDAAFALQPGQFSPVVETAFGYHILWRPALPAVRDTFETYLADIMSNRLDSMFLDSLTNKTGISVRGRAPAIVRAAVGNLRGAKERSRTLATWRGGSLSEKQMATWLQAFPAQTRGQVANAPDSTLVEFVKFIATRQQIVSAAAARHIGLTPGQRDTVRMHYRDDLLQMLAGMAVAPESLVADTSNRSLNKSQVAARHVDTYFTAITNQPGSRQYFEVPPFLGDVLRSRADWKINAAGVDRALERAKTLRGPETPAAQQMSPAPIQRAPGGPPVGGQPRVIPPTRTIR